eukprot:gene42301-52450_t
MAKGFTELAEIVVEYKNVFLLARPTLGVATRNLFSTEYLGCFMVMILLGFGNLITVSYVVFPPPILPTATLASDLGIRSRTNSRASVNNKDDRLSGHDSRAISLSNQGSLHDAPALLHNPISNEASDKIVTTTRGSVSQEQQLVPKRTILSILVKWSFIIP